jgi:hypothetical protein
VDATGFQQAFALVLRRGCCARHPKAEESGGGTAMDTGDAIGESEDKAITPELDDDVHIA